MENNPVNRWEILVFKLLYVKPKVKNKKTISWLMNDPRTVTSNYVYLE
jgi:hypothetical protein